MPGLTISLGVLLLVRLVVPYGDLTLNYVCLSDGTLKVENPLQGMFFSASAYNVDSLVHCNTTGVQGSAGNYSHFLITGCEKNQSIAFVVSSRDENGSMSDGIIGGEQELYLLFCNELDNDGTVYQANLYLTVLEPDTTDPSYAISSLSPVDVTFSITTSIWDPGYSSALNTADIGTLLKWHIKGPTEFDLLPVSCVAYGGTTVGGSTRKTLTMEGCSQDITLLSHFAASSSPYKENQGAIYTDLYAFKFVAHDYVTLACTVRVCTNGSAACQQQCNSERRKRDYEPFSRRDLDRFAQLLRERKTSVLIPEDKSSRSRRPSSGYVVKSLRITENWSSSSRLDGEPITLLLRVTLVIVLARILDTEY